MILLRIYSKIQVECHYMEVLLSIEPEAAPNFEVKYCEQAKLKAGGIYRWKVNWFYDWTWSKKADLRGLAKIKWNGGKANNSFPR